MSNSEQQKERARARAAASRERRRNAADVAWKSSSASAPAPARPDNFPRTPKRPEPRPPARIEAAASSGALTPDDAIGLPREEIWFDDHGNRDPNASYRITPVAPVIPFIF